MDASPTIVPLTDAHARTTDDVLAALATTVAGLRVEEAARRLHQVGPNELPERPPRPAWAIFIFAFRSPLVVVLLVAAVLALLTGDRTDALFIGVVLVLDALIGTAQEVGAERSARALRALVPSHATVRRAGTPHRVATRDLVPGDVLQLEAGDRVPADGRLLETHELQVDESSLTGESLAVSKEMATLREQASPLAERVNMIFSGTHVVRGRGLAVVTATGPATEMGHLAGTMHARPETRPPLLQRIDRMVGQLGLFAGIIVVVLGGVGLARGYPPAELLTLAVALAVAAIPEGLPMAITITLAVALRRMSRHNVIVRQLAAVEALGSCTTVATDKTGTLTQNRLTLQQVVCPEAVPRVIDLTSPGDDMTEWLKEVARAAIQTNDAYEEVREGGRRWAGDAVDVALRQFALAQGIAEPSVRHAEIPFASERQYSAAVVSALDGGQTLWVKGAPETVLARCATMATPAGSRPLAPEPLLEIALRLAEEGSKVLALARRALPHDVEGEIGEEAVSGLELVALLGLRDPLRPEAAAAISAARGAGLRVVMITGDHPRTALTIARQLGLATSPEEVLTGTELEAMQGRGGLTVAALRPYPVLARVTPQQKFQVVEALMAGGEIVAVTGDGANDAPALKAAHVGIAMGERGTAAAREAADLILTDDNFASVVAGIAQGRLAYANVRKVIFLLLATGVSEIALFVLALLTGLPLPLTALQLLWMNLVTEGIQDIALAFEPAEGDELRRPPRPPSAPILDRPMRLRIVVAALATAALTFGHFQAALAGGATVESARNTSLLLMVLCQNLLVGVARSEHRSVFALSPLRNPFLLLGTLAAQLLHIGAMYWGPSAGLLDFQPVSLATWGQLLALALGVVVVMEVQTWWLRRQSSGASQGAR